ncbi:MAG: hypothetical protein ACPL3C_09600, partial [Pyrobaculum sp.]
MPNRRQRRVVRNIDWQRVGALPCWSFRAGDAAGAAERLSAAEAGHVTVTTMLFSPLCFTL